MALIDHSFHDFDIEQWINNFDELTEPEYIINSVEEIQLSPDIQEFLALIKKDPEGIYDKIVSVLGSQDMPQLYMWTIHPEMFVKETGLHVADNRYIKFLSEFISGYILFRNKWDRNQLGKEVRNFIQNLPQPYNNRRHSRLKQCTACGYNLSDLFAATLTADNILDDTPVAVVCPHCNALNYFKY